MPITGKQVKPTPPRKPIVPPAAHSAVISDEKMKDFFSFTGFGGQIGLFLGSWLVSKTVLESTNIY